MRDHATTPTASTATNGSSGGQDSGEVEVTVVNGGSMDIAILVVLYF